MRMGETNENARLYDNIIDGATGRIKLKGPGDDIGLCQLYRPVRQYQRRFYGSELKIPFKWALVDEDTDFKVILSLRK